MFPAFGRALFGPSKGDLRREKETIEREEAARKRQEEKEKRDHEERMKELEAVKENEEHCKNELETIKKQLKKLEDEQPQIEGEIAEARLELNEIEDHLQKVEQNINEELEEYYKKVEAAKLKYKENNDKIRAAIEKTNVDEGSIPQFLNLINDGLLIATLNNTTKREELNAKIGAFGEVIARKTVVAIPMETFFQRKLKRFVKYLKDAECDEMDDVLCDTDKEFKEDDGIVDIIKKGIAAENEEIKKHNDTLEETNEAIQKSNTDIKDLITAIEEEIALIQEDVYKLREEKAMEQDENKRKKKEKELKHAIELNAAKKQTITEEQAKLQPLKEARKAVKELKETGPIFKKLQKLCMREQAEKGWMKQAEQKKTIVKLQLKEVAPLLATFFGAIDSAVTDARRYLEFGAFNTEQQKVVDDALISPTYSSITLKEESKAHEEEEEKQSTVDIDAFEKERQISLNKIPKGLNNQQADDLKVARNQNNALMTAAVAKLHVVDALASTFEGGKYPETRKTGLTLAQDVENCSLEIIRSQATIRASIAVARQLIEFKPAKPGKEAKEFWKVIDAGIINIFENYIEMMKIAATYFGFFVKFRSAFEHYSVCYEIAGEKVDLTVATEYIQRDVKAFTKFKTEMQAVVDKLTNDAKAVIRDCVNQTSGARNFNEAQEAREDAEAQLRKQLAKLREEQSTKKAYYDTIYNEKKEAVKTLTILKSKLQQQSNQMRRLTSCKNNILGVKEEHKESEDVTARKIVSNALVVCIGIENYEELDNIDTRRDIALYRSIFEEKFKYKVITNDLEQKMNTEQLKAFLQEARNALYDSNNKDALCYDGLIVTFGGHGTTDSLLCSDGTKLKHSDMRKIFFINELKDTPKIFMIDACRSEDDAIPVNVEGKKESDDVIVSKYSTTLMTSQGNEVYGAMICKSISAQFSDIYEKNSTVNFRTVYSAAKKNIENDTKNVQTLRLCEHDLDVENVVFVPNEVARGSGKKRKAADATQVSSGTKT